MSHVRELIRSIVDDRRLSLSHLSTKVLKKNHAYLQQYLERGIPAKLPEDVRAALAPALGLNEDQLRETAQPVARVATAKTASNLETNVGARVTYDQAQWPRDLPVLGIGECGPGGWSLLNGEIVKHIPRPPNLAGVPKAYAIYAREDSMEPRYYDGELLHVDPTKPVQQGNFVVVQLTPLNEGEPPRALVKRLVRRSASKVVFAQLNPKKELEFKASEIISIHKIVGTAEG